MRSNEQPQPAHALHGVTPKPYSGPVSTASAQPDRLIRQPEVSQITGLGKTSIYSIPDFPKRVVLSRRAVGWRMSEVCAWVESRTAVGA